MGFVRIDSDYTSFFPEEIVSNKTLSLKLSASVRILQNLFKVFENNLSSINTFKNSILNKRLFVRETAKSGSFSILKETFYKTCGGHDIRVSEDYYHTEKKAQKAAEKYEKDLKKMNKQNPELKEFSTYLQKQGKSHYDVRLSFTHVDNVPICNYPAILQRKLSTESVLNVLDLFESALNQHQLDIESSYSTLLDLIFKDCSSAQS